jgi:hypothetical protein
VDGLGGAVPEAQAVVLVPEAALPAVRQDTGEGMEDLVERLRVRARIRRGIKDRKSVQEGKPDRIADLLDEAALEIERLAASRPTEPKETE